MWLEWHLNYHCTVAASSAQGNTATTSPGQALGHENNRIVTSNKPTKALYSIMGLINVELECYERMVGSRHKSTEPEEKPSKNTIPQRITSLAAVLHGNARDFDCPFCKSMEHSLFECNTDLTIKQKKSILCSDRHCYRCLKKNPDKVLQI